MTTFLEETMREFDEKFPDVMNREYIKQWILSRLTLQRKEMREKVEGMICVECDCPEPKKWTMNRCTICKKVGVNQVTANQALSDIINALRE